MKSILLITLASLSTCTAQTYVTNWIAPGPQYRLVGGQLYDISLSSKWVPLSIKPEWFAQIKTGAGGSSPTPGTQIDIAFSNERETTRSSQIIHIKNFPYNPRDFVIPPRPNYQTPRPSRNIMLRVLPIDSVTNWNNGAIRSITRSYNYGVQATDKIPIVTIKK